MVEGHHGSCICGKCLAQAYREVIQSPLPQPTNPPATMCVLCLEERAEPGFSSPIRPQAFACKRCLRMAATALSRDTDSDWKV